MRPFCFLLALFFLFLDLVPCSDNADACGHLSGNHIEKENQPEPWQEQCPPMCSCCCCNMHVVFVHQPIFFAESGVAIQISFYKTKDKPVNRPGAIWLPPKLAA